MDAEMILAAKRTPVVYVKPDSPVSEAVELMHEKGIGSVLIMENEEDQVLGILTARHHTRRGGEQLHGAGRDRGRRHDAGRGRLYLGLHPGFHHFRHDQVQRSALAGI